MTPDPTLSTSPETPDKMTEEEIQAEITRARFMAELPKIPCTVCGWVGYPCICDVRANRD